MSTEKVATLIADTQKKLAHYLSELAVGHSFEMAGFDSIVQTIQAEISALKPTEMLEFKEDIGTLMEMLDSLQKGLEDKRNIVRSEIENINRQLTATQAYRNTDSGN